MNSADIQYKKDLFNMEESFIDIMVVRGERVLEQNKTNLTNEINYTLDVLSSPEERRQ